MTRIQLNFDNFALFPFFLSWKQKGAPAVLLGRLLKVKRSVAFKLCFHVKKLVFLGLSIFLENADVSSFDLWDARKVKAFAFHFWNDEWNSPE
jgi:hypothetical protein